MYRPLHLIFPVYTSRVPFRVLCVSYPLVNVTDTHYFTYCLFVASRIRAHESPCTSVVGSPLRIDTQDQSQCEHREMPRWERTRICLRNHTSTSVTKKNSEFFNTIHVISLSVLGLTFMINWYLLFVLWKLLNLESTLEWISSPLVSKYFCTHKMLNKNAPKKSYLISLDWMWFFMLLVLDLIFGSCWWFLGSKLWIRIANAKNKGGYFCKCYIKYMIAVIGILLLFLPKK